MYKYPHIMLNPGELIEGHQKLDGNCVSCHELFWGIPNEKCIACHKLDEIGRKADTNASNRKILFHNSLGRQKCTACHTDHKGLNSETAYNAFDHDLLSENIKTRCGDCHIKPSGKLHEQLSATCSDCHNTKGWKSSVAFDHNAIVAMDKADCLACHQKPEDSFHGSFSNKCSDCHNTDKWVPSTFDHSVYFLLDQNHDAECKTCHSQGNFSIYTCYGCHEHSEGKIQEEHSEEGVYNFSYCISCHRSANKHGIQNKNEGNNNSKDFSRSKSKEREKGDGDDKEGDDD